MLQTKSSIRDLHPFLDNLGILSVGGHLQNSELPYHKSNQSLFTSHHWKLTSSPYAYQSAVKIILSLREKHWIPGIWCLTRTVLHKCVTCFKLNFVTHSQLMGNFPSYRLHPAHAFINRRIDYACPMYIKTGTRRSKPKVKVYVAVFVCLVMWANQMELVSDLTTEAFKAALCRFMVWRVNLYSDNGENFKGAHYEVNDNSIKIFENHHRNCASGLLYTTIFSTFWRHMKSGRQIYEIPT